MAVEEAGGGPLPDAGHAGQAVARIAAQDGQVGVARTVDAVLGAEGGPVEGGEGAHSLDRVEDADAARVVDELEEVPVAGDDVDRPGGAVGEGADDVVGLVVRGAEPGDADRVENVEDDGYLRGEGVGHGLGVRPFLGLLGDAVGLVGGDERHSPGRAPVLVQAGDEIVRFVIGHEPGDEIEQAPHGVDGSAVGCADGLRDAEVGPEVEGRGVEQHESSGHTPDHAVRGAGGMAPWGPKKSFGKLSINAFLTLT